MTIFDLDTGDLRIEDFDLMCQALLSTSSLDSKKVNFTRFLNMLGYFDIEDNALFEALAYKWLKDDYLSFDQSLTKYLKVNKMIDSNQVNYLILHTGYTDRLVSKVKKMGQSYYMNYEIDSYDKGQFDIVALLIEPFIKEKVEVRDIISPGYEDKVKHLEKLLGCIGGSIIIKDCSLNIYDVIESFKDLDFCACLDVTTMYDIKEFNHPTLGLIKSYSFDTESG